MDDLIVQFTAITSTSPQQATQYLTLTDNNLEQAVQLFFEDPGLADTSTPRPVPSSSRSRPERPSRSNLHDDEDVIRIPSDDEEDVEMSETEAPDPAPDTNDDEEIARRMQEEFYSGSAVDPDGVRAPISRTTETLVGPDATWGDDEDDTDSVVHRQILDRQRRAAERRRAQHGRPGIFNQRDSQAAVWEDDDADPAERARALAIATGGASTQSSKRGMLAEMFRPPYEIISGLPWDQARDAGKADEKWLLVNVQDPSIFDCQVLNRDVWKNKEVKEVIKDSFIFLQYSQDDPRGQSYMQYYFHPHRDNQDAYPHIAIVDPRTGEQVKVWPSAPVPSADEFLMQVYDFLERYSLKADAKNPVAKRKAAQPKAMDFARMTEDEMLELALQNSLAQNRSGPGSSRSGSGVGLTVDDPDALTKSIISDKGKGKARAREDSGNASTEDLIDLSGDDNNNAAADAAAAATTNGTAGDDVFASIDSNRPHVEPPPDPATTTRIQFRHAGGRTVRRFALVDPVRRIYEWLKAEPLVDGKRGRTFELTFMGRNLLEDVEKGIQEAGLKNGSVMVEFLGEGD